jgi:hypothetical protein
MGYLFVYMHFFSFFFGTLLMQFCEGGLCAAYFYILNEGAKVSY